MINRYTITQSKEALISRFSAELGVHYQPRYNAAPSQLLPIITSDSPEGFSWFYWGLSPQQSQNKPISEKILHRKVEDLLNKPVFKKNLLSHRCLIPADGFYLWKPLGKKTMVPYRVVLAGKGLFGIAGVWEEFEGEDGKPQHTFNMITRVSPPAIEGSSDRLPFLLSPDMEQAWLKSKSNQEIEQLLNTLTDFSFEQYSVSPIIDQTTKDLPSMILHTPPSDQFGNLTLFD